jgi:ribonuclease P protein component
MLGRIRTGAGFGRVRREGSYWGGKRCSVSAAPLAVQVSGKAVGQADDEARVEAGSSPARVGYVTPKRIGGAVQRNRARRLLRECMHSLAGSVLPNWDIVIIAQPSISTPGVRMQDVRDELEWLLKKAHLLKPG